MKINKADDKFNRDTDIVVLIVIFLTSIIFYLPIIINNNILIARGNDLQEFFWPILNYVKNHLLADGAVPLWNTLFLSGSALLPDPQSPIFYPINILSMIVSLKYFFVFSIIIHSVIAGYGMFLVARKTFNFSIKTSFVISILYITTPKLASYIEAGHVGLIYSYAWIPLIIFFTNLILKKPDAKKATYLAIALSLLYYSHLPTFIVFLMFAFLLFLTGLVLKLVVLTKRSIYFFLLAGFLTVGFTGISLFPQIEAQNTSTRYLLLKNPDVYPKWNSIFEPLKNAITPGFYKSDKLQNIDTEKWIPVGIFASALSFLGFLKLNKRNKIIVFFGLIILILLNLNNASPIYNLLLKQKWYLLLRVSTRFWICIQFIIFYLLAIAFETISKRKKIFFILAIATLIESIFLGWTYIQKPIKHNQWLAPAEVYDHINKDKTLYRVFCVTRCLSQKTASDYDFQLLDGYATIQQKNFNQESWQLVGSYWNYYTLSIPPIGVYTQEKLKPDIEALGEYNVKYILSPYKLRDSRLTLNAKIKGFYIYTNNLLLPRAYYFDTNQKLNIGVPVLSYSPNLISLDTSNVNSGNIRLSEVFSPGWRAYTDNKEIQVMETPNALRSINITTNVKKVDFIYSPKSFYWGKILAIVATTIAFLILVKKDNYFRIK